jgi:hypothetical protein
MSDSTLYFLNKPIVKIGYALLVAYSACFDPVYAVALTTLIIITMQELYRRTASRASTASTASAASTKTLTNIGVFEDKPFIPAKLELPQDAKNKTQQSVVIDQMPDNVILATDSMVFNEINKHALQRIPDPNDSMIAEYDFYKDPAYQTITENLHDKNSLYLNRNQFVITENNLEQVQTNQEPGVNQNTPISVFPKVLNAQGLPNGFDKGVGGSNPQLANF